MIISGSAAQVGNETIVIRAKDLETGLYSNAPDYYVKTFQSGTGVLQNSNCVYDVIISDVLAAYNMGLVGSTTIDPRYPGTPVGTEPSAQWYSVFNTPYANKPQFKPSQLFSVLQPNSPTPYYNPYAAYLSGVTDAYGFPYTDKAAKPQLDITPGAADAMVITILPDVVTPSGLTSPRPGQFPQPIKDRQTTRSFLSVRGQPAMNTSEIKLHLEITHPLVEELTVRLIAPWGQSFVFHEQTGGDSENLVLAGVPLPASQRDRRPNGYWVLLVEDAKRGNTGQIESWGLEFPE